MCVRHDGEVPRCSAPQLYGPGCTGSTISIVDRQAALCRPSPFRVLPKEEYAPDHCGPGRRARLLALLFRWRRDRLDYRSVGATFCLLHRDEFSGLRVTPDLPSGHRGSSGSSTSLHQSLAHGREESECDHHSACLICPTLSRPSKFGWTRVLSFERRQPLHSWRGLSFYRSPHQSASTGLTIGQDRRQRVGSLSAHLTS